MSSIPATNLTPSTSTDTSTSTTTGSGGSTDISVNSVFNAFQQGVTSAGTDLNQALATAGQNANDPASLVALQQKLSNYNIALQVQSAVVKSIEDTAKSITQKL